MKAIYLYKKQRTWGSNANKAEEISCEFLGDGIIDKKTYRIKVVLNGYEQIKEVRKHLVKKILDK